MFKIDFFGFPLLYIYLRANLYYFHSFFYLWVWFALPFLPRCKDRSLIWPFFLMYAFTALHFIVGDVFTESHTCWYVLFIFWFVSRYFLSFFFYYFLAYWLFKSVFNLHILVGFPTFPSTINFCFIALWQEKVPLYDLSLFRVDFGEGNGTPLQYSCLENPMDRGAW